jgi:hypothetical protein
MMAGVFGDLRLAARRLRESPGFAVAVVILIALGIGANTAVFTLANAVLLRTLPVPEADRLALLAFDKPDGSSQYMIPRDVYRRLREENDVLQGFAAATFPPITPAWWPIFSHLRSRRRGWRCLMTGVPRDFSGSGQRRRPM